MLNKKKVFIPVFFLLLTAGFAQSQQKEPVYKLGPQLIPVQDTVIPFHYKSPRNLVTTCNNSDFYTGTFNNWIGCYGTFSGNPPTVPIVFLPCQTAGFNATRHVIMPLVNQTYDALIGSPLTTVFAGETHSARLGDVTGGGHAEQLKFNVTVGQNNYLFVYRWASVLESYNHIESMMPRFTLQVQDLSGNPLGGTCGYYEYTAPSCAPPSPTCVVPPEWIYKVAAGNVKLYWHDWTTVALDLTPFQALGTVQIVFTTRGCSQQAHRGYAYISTYCSAITIQTSLCEGATQAILTAPPGFSTYLWSTGETTPSITVDNPVDGTLYWVDVTSNNGCTAHITNTLHFTIVTPAFSTVGPTCMNQQTTFSDQSTASQNTIDAWDWDFNDGSAIDHTQNPTHVFTLPNTYNVKLTAYSTEGCHKDVTHSITILPEPVPTITGSVDVCVGTTGTSYFTESSMTGYTWSISPGGTITSGSGTNTINVSWNTAGPQNVSVNYADVNGCTAASATVKNVTVNALPVPAITGSASACAGVTGLGYSTESSKTGYTWAISPGGVITSGAGTNTITVSWITTGAQSISVNYIDANGCTAASATVKNVTVHSLPVPLISGLGAVCRGVIDVNYSTEVSMSAYTWTVSAGGNITSGTGTNSIKVDWLTAGAQTVSVNYTNENGCSASSATVKNVTVNSLPIPTITGFASVCVGISGLNYFTEPSMTGYTWSISPGGMITSGAGTDAITVNWNTAGAQSVTVNYTDANGCTATSASIKNIIVNTLPVPTITGFSSVCEGVTGIAYSTESSMTGYSWTVSPGGAITSGSTTNTINVSWNTPGAQTVSVNYTNASGCLAASSTVKNVTVNPLPTATIIGTTAVCQNTVAPLITFTGASATAPYTFTYTINGGAPLTIATVAGNSVTVAAPTSTVGTFIFDLVSVQDGSTTTCSQTQSGNATVTVNPLPTATIAGTTSVCQNAAAPFITFTGASSTAPYTFTYNINGGGPLTVTTITGNSVTVAAPTTTVGPFIYNLVSVQDASLTTCSQAQSGNATVTVNPLPTATIAGTTAVCQNAAAPLITFTGASATAPYTFTYTINGGALLTVSTVAGNSVTVAASTSTVGPLIYDLVSVQDGSTTTCSQAQSGSVTITVNPLPTATIAGTISVCQNAASPLITFTGSSSTAPYTFTYTINGGAPLTVTTVAGNSVTVAAPTTTVGPHIYALVSVQDGSITTCSQPQSGSATVTVNPLPTATIAGTTAVCQNSASPLITFTGASSTAPYTFTYTINGGAPLTVTTIAGNSVTLVAPTSTVGALIYDLVSVQDGSPTTCSQAQSGSATITVNPLPTATIAGTTAVCQNALAPLITFTGASSTAPYTFTYTINGGAPLTVTTIAGSIVTVPAPTSTVGTFIFALVSVQDGSTTTCSQAQSGNATVTVNPLPTATIAGTTSVCQNAAAPLITFTGASSTSPYTFTYNINGGAPLTVTTIAGNSVTVAAPTTTVGPFIYNLTSVQDASLTTCSQAQSGSATITVNPLPTATITGTTAVCQNAASPLITFTGSSATAPYTFTYTINGGALLTVSTVAGNSVTVAASTSTVGTLIYDLVSVQDGSSTICSQAQSGSVTITVNPLPTATIAGTLSVCQNAAPPLITFTGASSTAPYTFTYTINGGAPLTVTTVAGNSVTVAAPTTTVGPHIYALVSVQDGSSTACSHAQSGSATVTVNPLPTATIAGTTAVCQNSASPLITFTGASSTTPYTFTYTINGGAPLTVTTVAGNSVTIAAPTNVVGTITYALVSVLDGSPTACSQSQSGSATITVNPSPTALISGTTGVCLNAASPLITFTGGNATAPYTFTYNINGGPVLVISTGPGNNVTLAAPTSATGTFSYNLTGVQDGSGTSCASTQMGSATITVNPLPTASISGTTTVCQNSAAPLISFTGASTTAPYTFTYNINGGAPLNVTTVAGNSVTVAAPTTTVGPFIYNLVSVQDGSSTTCSQVQGGNAVITVNVLPTATIAGTTAVCQNSVAPLITFTGASTTAPYTFTYKINGGTDQIVTTSVGSSVTIPAPTTVGGTFTYTLVSVRDGSATACSQIQSGNATVTVNPLPTASITGTAQTCQNSVSPLITFTGSSASAPYTFTYKINGGANQFVTTSAGNSVTVPASTSGVGAFIYTLVSVQDASSTACSQLQSGNATVTVNPLPFVDLSLCNDPKTTTTSKPFTLKGGVPPGGQYYIDGILAGGGIFNPAALSASTHLITYSFTDFNTCSSTSVSVPITVNTGSPTGSCPATFIDPRDNHSYRAFTLGSHCWMLSNLNYGTKMASDLTPQSNNCAPEKYCLASDPTCVAYGGLYQWDELMQYQVPAPGLSLQGLCPPEWHVPTEAEWHNLIDAVASMTPGDGLAGSYLKDTNPGFGFHVLLDGIYYLNNTWAFTSGSLTATMFWTSANSGAYRAIARGINNFDYGVSFYPSSRANSFPVRCVKD